MAHKKKKGKIFLKRNKEGVLKFQSFDPINDIYGTSECQKTTSKQRKIIKKLSSGFL